MGADLIRHLTGPNPSCHRQGEVRKHLGPQCPMEESASSIEPQSVRPGMNTTALRRLVRAQSNDTMCHPPVKEGAWYTYSANRNACAWPRGLLLRLGLSPVSH